MWNYYWEYFHEDLQKGSEHNTFVISATDSTKLSFFFPWGDAVCPTHNFIQSNQTLLFGVFRSCYSLGHVLPHHSWNTNNYLHRVFINAPHLLLRACDSWVIRFDPLLTTSLYPHSFYWSASLRTSLSLSTSLLLTSLWDVGPSLHWIPYPEFYAAVQQHWCNPVQVTSALQSVTQPVLLPFTLLKREWRVRCQLSVIHQNPCRNVKVWKHSQLRTIYFVLWEAPMLNEIKNNLARLFSLISH